MKKRILVPLLFIGHIAFSQLMNPSIGAGLAYTNYLDARTDAIYGVPGITIRGAADISDRHILMGGYSVYLPSQHTFTANGRTKNYVSYRPDYMQYNYSSKTEASEFFIEVMHLVGNTTENKIAVYFHTGVDIYFFKRTNTHLDLDTANYNAAEDIKMGKTKFGALYIYAGAGMQFRFGSSYAFFEFKASVPVPTGDMYLTNYILPVGFNLGYRFCFDD